MRESGDANFIINCQFVQHYKYNNNNSSNYNLLT